MLILPVIMQKSQTFIDDNYDNWSIFWQSFVLQTSPEEKIIRMQVRQKKKNSSLISNLTLKNSTEIVEIPPFYLLTSFDGLAQPVIRKAAKRRKIKTRLSSIIVSFVALLGSRSRPFTQTKYITHKLIMSRYWQQVTIENGVNKSDHGPQVYINKSDRCFPRALLVLKLQGRFLLSNCKFG